MNTKPLLLTALLLALAACEKPAPAPAPKPTTPPPPPAATAPGPIAVTVTEDTAAKKCEITAPAKTHTVTVKKGVFNITWNLSGPGGKDYVFDDANGIAFQNAPTGVFTKQSNSGTVFVMVDKNDDPAAKGKWDYHINVQNKDGSIKCKLDPSVINDQEQS